MQNYYDYYFMIMPDASPTPKAINHCVHSYLLNNPYRYNYDIGVWSMKCCGSESIFSLPAFEATRARCLNKHRRSEVLQFVAPFCYWV